jgi:Lar family restriction alleviation protein
MTELKPCPFCGEQPVVDWRMGKEKYIPLFQIRCENNDCTTQPETWYFKSEAEAIQAWNRRKENE